MLKNIKERLAKISERGIYVQDKELSQTNFKPGDYIKYVVDPKNKKIVILQSDEKTTNRVSKRELKNGHKPVIDIRSKDALVALNGSDYWQVKIFDDQVVVEGYVEEEGAAKGNLKEKVKQKVQSKLGLKSSKVVDITSVLNVKKNAQIVLSKKELNKVVGDEYSYDQLDLFELEPAFSTSNIVDIQESLKNIHVPLQVTSLFAGCGLMDKGFADVGYDITYALEIDEDACKTYRSNLGEHIVTADITKFDKYKLPKTSVLIGGSPCQGFSNSNRQSNFLDNPNNRLVKEFIEAVKKSNAKVFVLENVPQILTAGDGQFKEEIYEALSEYEITSGVLSSAQFGVAQDRKRAIFIGSKIGAIHLPEPQYKPEDYLTVGHALAGLHERIPNQLDYSKPKPDTEERMKHIAQGRNWQDIPEHLKTKRMMSGNTHSSVYRRLEEHKVSITLPNVRKSNITHPNLNRTLSVRECARLFSVPDDFVFKGKLSAMQQQIANSVPVNLAKAVATSVKEAITMFNIRNNKQLVTV